VEHAHVQSSTDRWLDAMWPFVRDRVPAPPASVLEIGCGRRGGFVPRLAESGHVVLGVDPEAPDGDAYVQSKLEDAELAGEFDAIVACTSLHHVADPEEAVAAIASTLRPTGALVVIEWDWESLDEQTARWAFERLSESGDGWLDRHGERWRASGRSWDEYLRSWASDERIHRWSDLSRCLDAHFSCSDLTRGPYLFADLDGTSAAGEQAAIDAGEIRATRVDYAGVRKVAGRMAQ
jgi:SAM-dependent methyltransferase